MKKLTDVVINALHEVVEQKGHDPAKISKYFDSLYTQRVDGKELGYAEFVDHIAFLKSHTRSMAVTLVASAEENGVVFTHHSVAVQKTSGEGSTIEVFARFTLSAGKIIRCEELTRQVTGDPSDHDLGSRTGKDD